MEDKYIKFYQNFHKAFDGKSNHCFVQVNNGGVEMKVTVILSAVFLLIFSSFSFTSESHWNYGSGLGSKSHWNYGSGLGSKSHWNYGSGFGSESHWNYGSGTGSESHWNYGSGQGSESHWNYGSGKASESNWNYGSGQGSESHWNYGSGRTFNDSPFIDLCLGLLSDGENPPDFCSIYPNLVEML